jgi:hypothetical protein
LSRLIAAYRAAAILLLNTVLLFILVNIGLWIALALRDKRHGFGQNNPALIYPEASLATVYPDMSTPEWKAMLVETWSRPYVYDDFVVFRERPSRGKYVNVHEAGFRQVANQGPWPPESTNLNVFVFGGSTMFGYGVPDHQTVPSHLQVELGQRSRKRVCVYNFGVGYYYSTQERILFERLLSHGYKPDLAIFVDGLNDFWKLEDVANFSEDLAELFGSRSKKSLAIAFFQELPIGRVVRKLQRVSKPAAPATTQASVTRTLAQFQSNKSLIESICDGSGITPLFVWQPVPTYQYNTNYHLFLQYPETFRNHAAGYPQMEQRWKDRKLGGHFIWCADLQRDETECLYVDATHYSGKFSKKLAQAIVQRGVQSGLLTQLGLQASPSAR